VVKTRERFWQFERWLVFTHAENSGHGFSSFHIAGLILLAVDCGIAAKRGQRLLRAYHGDWM
jgi:hypothetical protein